MRKKYWLGLTFDPLNKKRRMINKKPTRNGQEQHSEYVLRLFVAGASPNSLRAINNLKNILEKNIPGKYLLEIIDVHQQPESVQKEQLVALPLLRRVLPLPERKLIGDMSQTLKVVEGLGLKILL